MKYPLFLFIACLAIDSCAHQAPGTSSFADAASLHANASAQKDTSEIKINANFPFGCADLAKYKYPHDWAEDHEHDGPNRSPEGKEFGAISTLLHVINNAKTISPPNFKQLEYLELNNRYHDDAYYFDTLAVKSIDSCVYRLPDIGGYQCYYYRQQTKKQTYGDYGSLLLLDPATQIGKLLTLYFEYGGDQHVNLRYYLINKDTIHIYDGVSDDEVNTLSESFKITINSDKKIVINEIH